MTTVEMIARQAVEDALMLREFELVNDACHINQYASKLAGMYQDKVQKEAYVAIFATAYESGNSDVTAYL